MKYFLLFFAFFYLLAAKGQHLPWRAGEMEIKASFTSPNEAQRIGSMGFKGDIYPHHAYLYLTPDELEVFKLTGINYSVSIPDLNTWSESFGTALVPPGYYTFNQIKNIADSLVANFPEICKKVTFGFTPQMKELAALKISDNVHIDENEAEILFDGGIHGNEVGASQNVIRFARDLCLEYGSDTAITKLVNSREIWIYYCVNPYGRDNMTRENSNGVDINRDFGYMWGSGGSSSGPFSQPESKALRDCQYTNQFTSYTNYHSGAETVSYPWSYRYSPTPDNTQIAALAEIYSSNSGYPTLPYGQGSQIMYLIQGSTKDFNYGSIGSVAWSIEISLDKQPAGANIDYYYNINKPAMLALVEHSGYGIEGTVTDAITGVPVKAAVWVGANYPTFTDGDAGDYHKYLIPGTYNLHFTANGYDTLTVNNVVVNALQSTVTDVLLQPKRSQYAYRTCIAHIPSFNAQNPGDEGYTAACLGAPDHTNYSLGRGGYIMVDMQTPVKDEPGLDITVYEGDTGPEGYAVYALTEMDGYWNYIGSGNGTFHYDLATAGLDEAQFFLILDDNNGTANVSDAGFDFDAIENIHAPIPDTLAHLSGTVYDSDSGLPLPGVEVTIADSILITDTSGYYSLNSLRGTYTLCASIEDYNVDCDTVVLQAAAATTHNFFLNYNVGLKATESEQSIRLMPNPFSDKLNIQFSCATPARVIISLSSLSGAGNTLLANGMFGAGEHNLSFSPDKIAGYRLSPGIYLLTIDNGLTIQTKQVVKISAK